MKRVRQVYVRSDSSYVALINHFFARGYETPVRTENRCVSGSDQPTPFYYCPL